MKCSDILEQSEKYIRFKLVEGIEIHAYFVLNLRAAFRFLNVFDHCRIWNHESRYEIFAASISINKFKFISRFKKKHVPYDEKVINFFACEIWA